MLMRAYHKVRGGGLTVSLVSWTKGLGTPEAMTRSQDDWMTRIPVQFIRIIRPPTPHSLTRTYKNFIKQLCCFCAFRLAACLVPK